MFSLYRSRTLWALNKHSTFKNIKNIPAITRLYSSEGGPKSNQSSIHTPFSLSKPIENLVLRSRLTADMDTAKFIAKSASISIYSLAGLTILGTLGIDTKPLITGIGVTGFAVGFALKEIATNFLSGVLLVFGKPFRKGDHLKIMSSTSLEGVVESIDARYVLLRTKEKGLLMVPSVVVYSNPIHVLPAADVAPKK